MDEPAELLGEDPAINLVREKLLRLLERQQAGRRLPAILIQGETGTGKGLVARLVHRAGPRSGGPFVVINCPAIPETLFEAELFGFERGAFTDARRPKPGLFQAAHEGTLFLDEVGLLPEPLQAKLLTAIEERSVRRLGGTHPELVDACFISATNTDLQAAVRERRFREDLYHRLAVVTLDLPALRDRGRDVLLLAERFLARACADYGLPPRRLDAQAQARLLAHPWPGNIRELANVIERAVLFADSPVLTGEMLDPLPVNRPHLPAPPASAVAVTPEEAMRQHLRSVLEQSEWNISHAAARLGIARNTLYARLAKFGVCGHPPHKAPPHRASRPESAPASAPAGTRLQWEQRTLTLLRVALSGAEGFDAWPQTSRPLEDAIAKVHTFGGRVEDVTPAGLVAAFGLDPVEDAPRRAAHAAMAIQKSAQRARERNGGVLEVKIGLHVASVVIGLVGERIEIDADAKRGPWRLLDQLLQIIEPGGTIACAAAAPFLERRFELVPMGAVGAEPGPAYRLTGQERRGFGPWGATTRFVGRRDELETLWSRLAPALSGHGQVVAVVGEPGVGKSRLFHEFTRSPRLDGWLVLESASVSYGQAMSYLPVVNLLKGYFQIGDRDTPQDIREKVTGKILTLDQALEPTLLALFALLDVPIDDPRWQSLDPSRRRQRTLEAIKRLLLREAQAQPLAIVFEDLHWIDSETQALLDNLVESLPPVRLLLLASYRPEYEHRWGGKTSYTQVRLDPLPPESGLELLDDLLGADATIESLKPILMQRTEGNPFFLEEYVRTLAETKVLAGERGAFRLARVFSEILVPATVQAILAARMDRLPPAEKCLLQTAAVIGKDVPGPLLQSVADRSDDELRRGLSYLQAAEFLYETGLFPDLEFTFKHALTQEVAYSSLLQEPRIAIHARIVTAIERLYPDRLSEQVEQLGHHALKGEVWEPAMRYLRLAGTKAAERYALREATGWFRQALSALAHLPETRTTLEQSVDIRLEHGPVLATLGDYRLVHENLSEAERLAEQLGDESRRGQVYWRKVNVHNHLGQVDQAVAWGAQALVIAERLRDLPLRRSTTTMLEQTHFMRGEYDRVIDLAQVNLSLVPAEEVSQRLGAVVPTSVYDRGWLVRSLVELGRFAEAAEPAGAAIQIAERMQHPYAIGWACYCAGNLHNWKGNWSTARSLYERAIEVFREADVVNTLPNVTAISSWVLACLDESAAAFTRAQEGERLLDLARAQQRISGNSWSYVWLCHSYLRLGRLEDAERLVERILEPRTASSEAYACHLRGEIAAHPLRWQPETAEGCYRRALTLAEGCAMRPLVAFCQLALGKLCHRTGRRNQAQQQLITATTMFREMDMRFWLAQAEVAMTETDRGPA